MWAYWYRTLFDNLWGNYIEVFWCNTLKHHIGSVCFYTSYCTYMLSEVFLCHIFGNWKHSKPSNVLTYDSKPLYFSIMSSVYSQGILFKCMYLGVEKHIETWKFSHSYECWYHAKMLMLYIYISQCNIDSSSTNIFFSAYHSKHLHLYIMV